MILLLRAGGLPTSPPWPLARQQKTIMKIETCKIWKDDKYCIINVSDLDAWMKNGWECEAKTRYIETPIEPKEASDGEERKHGGKGKRTRKNA